MKDMEKIHFECDCSSDEHRISIAFDVENKEAMISTFLPKSTFLKRLYHGIKYILGYSSKYGQFEETLLSNQKIKELRRTIDQYQNVADNLNASKIKQSLDDIAEGKPNTAYKNVRGGSRKDLLPGMGKKNGSTKV